MRTREPLGPLVAAAFVVAASGVELPNPLTLEAALSAAFAHNRALARGQLRVIERELAAEEARARFLPSVSPLVQGAELGNDVQWTYGVQVVQPTRYGSQIGAAATATDREAGFARERTLSVDLRQPLLRRFGRAVAEEPVRAASDQYRAERRAWEQQRADLALRLVELMEAIPRLDAQLSLESSRRDRLERLAALVRTRERQGRAGAVDTLRMEQSLAEADARLAALRERRESLTRELGLHLGAALPADLAIEPPAAVALDLPDLAVAVGIAFSNRLDLAQAHDDLAAAGRHSAIARRGGWPDLTLHATIRHTLFEGAVAAEDRRTDWFAGLSADGFPWRAVERIARERADLAEAGAEAAVALRRETIAREVADALAACRRAAAELQIAARHRELADRHLRAARRLYESGRGDAWSLADGESRHAAAEHRWIEVASAARLSAYALMHTLGTLIEHPADLRPPTASGATP